VYTGYMGTTFVHLVSTMKMPLFCVGGKI